MKNKKLHNAIIEAVNKDFDSALNMIAEAFVRLADIEAAAIDTDSKYKEIVINVNGRKVTIYPEELCEASFVSVGKDNPELHSTTLEDRE